MMLGKKILIFLKFGLNGMASSENLGINLMCERASFYAQYMLSKRNVLS